MNAKTINKSTAKKSFKDLRKAAVDLLPLAAAEADEAENAYHLTDKLVDEFRRTGLYAFLLPKALGGAELSWVEAMEITELMSHADGCAGWCLMVQGVMVASYGAFVPDEGAKTTFADGPDVTISGQGVPRGFAWAEDGGYRIKGDWGYGSGIHHAEWIHSGCFVMDGNEMKMGADGQPEVVLCHYPRDEIEITGNWDSHGLRGSGSYDYTLKDGELFVPESCCYLFDNPPQARGGIQYSAGLPISTTWGHTSWALGVGRRVLDELAKLSRERHDLWGDMHASPSFRKSYADAESKYRAARAFVYDAWTDLSETYAKGETASLEQIALVRLAMRFIHDMISEVSTFAHRASRGVGIRPGLLQRAYRDIHTGTQHILLADEISQECGKVMLGVTGDTAVWKLFGVVEN